jgi:hypothetical protein
MTLTRAQLAALTALHRDGELYGQGHALGLPGPRQSTLNALVSAGVAQRDPANGRRFLVKVHTYADGAGVWHVEVPSTAGVTSADDRAVARAVIAGEVAARAPRNAEPYRPRVEYVGAVYGGPDLLDPPTAYTYREA